jgi:hypothetical protein
MSVTDVESRRWRSEAYKTYQTLSRQAVKCFAGIGAWCVVRGAWCDSPGMEVSNTALAERDTISSFAAVQQEDVSLTGQQDACGSL